MDVTAVLALIERAVTIISALIAAGQAAEPAIEALLKMIRGAQDGTLTQADIDATDALLDKQIADFNLDLPPAGA